VKSSRKAEGYDQELDRNEAGTHPGGSFLMGATPDDARVDEIGVAADQE
jgi:hypothetical protein